MKRYFLFHGLKHAKTNSNKFNRSNAELKLIFESYVGRKFKKLGLRFAFHNSLVISNSQRVFFGVVVFNQNEGNYFASIKF